jgi:hypothetical protein
MAKDKLEPYQSRFIIRGMIKTLTRVAKDANDVNVAVKVGECHLKLTELIELLSRR